MRSPEGRRAGVGGGRGIAAAFLLLLLAAASARGATVSVKEPSVNLRAGPGLEHPIVDKLVRGEILEAVERRGKWLKVRRVGVTGWVFASLVTEPDGPVPSAGPGEEGPPRRRSSRDLPPGARDDLLRTSRGETAVEEYVPGKEYRVRIQTTSGDIVVELWPEVAPNHVKNFLHLAATGFYDGLTFHRVVPGFLIQGGDPRGDGTGGPGYTLPLEPGDRTHEAGVLSMAHRPSDPDSAGSQFFILLAPSPSLDGKYTAFGSVLDGMDTVRAIGSVATDAWGRPLEEVRIRTMRILERGDATDENQAEVQQ